MVRTNPQVSSHGRFRSVDGVVGYGTQRVDGNVDVGIHKRIYKLHKLVARAFHGKKPTPDHTVDHANLQRNDNHKDNLSYKTRSEQMQHSHANNTTRGTNANAMSKAVEGRKIGRKRWVRYPSLAHAAAALGLPNTAGISEVCLGRQHTTGDNYEFRYVEVPDLEGEVWRTIDGYTVSNKGRVRSVFGVISYGHTDNMGYKATSEKHARVHDLVARAFIGPPPTPQHTVDHADRNRSNNDVSNLSWKSKSEQAQATYQNEQRKRAGASKSKPILARKGDEEWKEFSSIRAAADGLKVPMANINRTFNPDSKRHRAGGYEFKLKEIPDLEGGVWMDIEDEWLNEL